MLRFDESQPEEVPEGGIVLIKRGCFLHVFERVFCAPAGGEEDGIVPVNGGGGGIPFAGFAVP